jgi:hypothetical protein
VSQPGTNVSRRNEPVATDTIKADTPAVDDGSICAQIFVGRNSLVLDAYGCHSDAEFSRTLEDNIRERGAMNLLISDAKAEVSLKSQDICRTLFIQTWQSEPHFQHQNYCERRWGNAKKPM